uniref:Major facilitator superfamily (MFS) profile domain-containing protein n=2 Tax=Timema TaxID=61471 RepID=A0A7R9G4C0_TIMSH|nr:unnamed protein product [Timema shepardi]
MKDNNEETEDAMFETLFTQIGSRGKFQKRFNYLYNMLFVMLVSMPYYNIVMALAVPDHWCHLPGRNGTNYTLDQWKEITLPRFLSLSDHSYSSPVASLVLTDGSQLTSDTQHSGIYSSLMASLVLTDGSQLTSDTQHSGCQFGWEYDKTWYTETAPSRGDWVCDKEIYITNLYSFNRVGDIVGTLVMGQLGDMIGRRPVFFVSLAMLVVGRLVNAFTSDMYYVFMAVTVFTSIPVTALYQTPLIIGIEVSASEERSLIALLQCIGWTAGLCTMPLVFWALSGDWFLFLIISTIPSVFFLFSCNLFPESPRWYAAMGKTSKCVKVLRKIAKVNGKTLPEETLANFKLLNEKKEQAYGIASLCSSWRLAKNTFLISTSWSLGNIMYYILMLNVNTMAGNPFMNFFWQSLVELPGYFLGNYLSEKLGRRWMNSGTFLLMALAHIPIILMINRPDLSWVITCMIVFIKLGVTVSGYAGYLQAMETFPTCVRQTGCALGSLAASIVGTLGPYIILLVSKQPVCALIETNPIGRWKESKEWSGFESMNYGVHTPRLKKTLVFVKRFSVGTTTDKRYTYGITALTTLLGAITTSFLPETLNQKLPETLADAAVFGKDQKYWALYQKSNIVLDGADVPLKTKEKPDMPS